MRTLLPPTPTPILRRPMHRSAHPSARPSTRRPIQLLRPIALLLLLSIPSPWHPSVAVAADANVGANASATGNAFRLSESSDLAATSAAAAIVNISDTRTPRLRVDSLLEARADTLLATPGARRIDIADAPRTERRPAVTFLRPPYLRPGDTVAIVAPAGRLPLRADTANVRKRFESWGLHVKFGPHYASRVHPYFAATDRQRADDLQRMIDDPTVKAVIAYRGGYGSVRLLPLLRLDGLRDRPKWIVGFSDITLLHLALRRLGIESIHGPMPGSFVFDKEKECDQDRERLQTAGNANTASETAPAATHAVTTDGTAVGANPGADFDENLDTDFGEGCAEEDPSAESLRCALFGRIDTIAVAPHPLNRPGVATGRLAGGNLTQLWAAQGTPEELEVDIPTVLFIEEVGEHAYRLDRMMQSLARSGKLRRVRAVLVGHLTDIMGLERFGVAEACEVIEPYLRDLGIPVVYGFPAGHEAPNRALYLGRTVTVEVDDRGACVHF